MSLLHRRDAVVGDENVRGVSGGERKRTTAMDSWRIECLFIDEVTTGFDAAASKEVVTCLRRVAATRHHRRVRLHQPRHEVFLFDELKLISRNGHGVPGPAGDSATAIEGLIGVARPPLTSRRLPSRPRHRRRRRSFAHQCHRRIDGGGAGAGAGGGGDRRAPQGGVGQAGVVQCVFIVLHLKLRSRQMGAFAFELAVVMLTAALIGIMYHEDFYRGPIRGGAGGVPGHLKELCRMPINDHIMQGQRGRPRTCSSAAWFPSTSSAPTSPSRAGTSRGLLLPYAIGGFGVLRDLTLPPLVYSIIFRQLVTPPQTFAEDYGHSPFIDGVGLRLLGPSRSREKSQVCAVFLVLSAFVFSGAPPAPRAPPRARRLHLRVATSSSYIRWALRRHIQEAVYHQRADVSGGWSSGW